MELLRPRFAILDIEAVALSPEREDGPQKGYAANIHNCTRKFALLLYDGTEYTFELDPCLLYRELRDDEIRTFRYAYLNCHGLPYKPTTLTSSGYCCGDALGMIMTLLEDHDVTVCYYKGGNIESDLLRTYIPLIDLERCGVQKSPERLTHHSPMLGIKDYKQQIVEMSCRVQYNHTPPNFGGENWEQ